MNASNACLLNYVTHQIELNLTRTELAATEKCSLAAILIFLFTFFCFFQLTSAQICLFWNQSSRISQYFCVSNYSFLSLSFIFDFCTLWENCEKMKMDLKICLPGKKGLNKQNECDTMVRKN